MRLKRKVVVNCHRCVVRKALIFVNVFRTCQRRHGGGGQVVVKSPAQVVGVSLPTVAPLGVGGIGSGGLQLKVNVDMRVDFFGFQ